MTGYRRTKKAAERILSGFFLHLDIIAKKYLLLHLLHENIFALVGCGFSPASGSFCFHSCGFSLFGIIRTGLLDLLSLVQSCLAELDALLLFYTRATNHGERKSHQEQY